MGIREQMLWGLGAVGLIGTGALVAILHGNRHQGLIAELDQRLEAAAAASEAAVNASFLEPELRGWEEARMTPQERAAAAFYRAERLDRVARSAGVSRVFMAELDRRGQVRLTARSASAEERRQGQWTNELAPAAVGQVLGAALAGQPRWVAEFVSTEEGWVRVVAAPRRGHLGAAYCVGAWAPLDEAGRALEGQIWELMQVGVGLFCLHLAMALWLAGRVSGALDRLANFSAGLMERDLREDEVAEADVAQVAERHGEDAMGRLAANMLAIARMAQERARELTRGLTQGVANRQTLTDTIAMVSRSDRSGRLVVETPMSGMELYFRKGELIAARDGLNPHVTPGWIMRSLLRVEDGRFRFEEMDTSGVPVGSYFENKTTERILMETSQQIDEEATLMEAAKTA